MVIRIKKEDSAYVYRVLESYEGLTNFSTVDGDNSLPYRDIKLHIAPDLIDEVRILIKNLGEEIDLELISGLASTKQN